MPGHVLIADDDHAILRLVEAVLSKHGWTVHKVDSAVNLEERVEAHKPDIIICDLCMPERDAVEFLLERHRREQESGTLATPVIILSGHDMVDDIIDEELNVAAVLRKPIQPEELLHTINAVFEHHVGQ